MATRNQVLSLFGASPEQIMARQRQEQAQRLQQIQNPYQQVGAVIGTGLGRLFGGEPAEVTRQRELYSQLEGVNFESPEQLRAAANALSQQFPDRALQLLTLANQREEQLSGLETDEARRRAAEAQAAESEARAGVVEVPVLTMETVTDITGGTTSRPKISTVPVPVAEADAYRKRFEEQFQQLNTGGGTTTGGPQPVPENAVRFNTGTGTPVVLVGDDYFTVTDEGNLGQRIENISALGGVVDPQRVTGDTMSSAPQQRKSQRGQMGRTSTPQSEEEETEVRQRSTRRRSNARQ